MSAAVFAAPRQRSKKSEVALRLEPPTDTTLHPSVDDMLSAGNDGDTLYSPRRRRERHKATSQGNVRLPAAPAAPTKSSGLPVAATGAPSASGDPRRSQNWCLGRHKTIERGTSQTVWSPDRARLSRRPELHPVQGGGAETTKALLATPPPVRNCKVGRERQRRRPRSLSLRAATANCRRNARRG